MGWPRYDKDATSKTQDPRLPKLPEGWRWGKFVSPLGGSVYLAVEHRANGGWTRARWSIKEKLEDQIAELAAYVDGEARSERENQERGATIDALLRGQP